MKRNPTAWLLVFALALSAACAEPVPPAPDASAMIAAAGALDEQFLAAFNSGDVDAMTALYANSPDTVSFLPDVMIMRGFDSIRIGLREFVVAGAAGATLALTESHHMVVGDAVASWGLWTMTMNGPDGSPITMSGRFTDLKAERDGRWVYLMDHASVPLPPPPAASEN